MGYVCDVLYAVLYVGVRCFVVHGCAVSRRYIDVVSHECDEPTSCLVQPIVAQFCEVMYFGCLGFRSELGLSEKDITRKERTTLAQLKPVHCRLLFSY